MSFLLNHNNIFTLVDNNTKYGVFCQFYSHSGISRPMQIQALNAADYSAAIDTEGHIHVIAMPSHYQITYSCYENSRYSKKTIIENTTETYTFSNPMIHAVNGEMHIFYLSNKVGSNAYAIVHQTLNAPSVETLLDTNYTLQNIKSFVFKNSIYIFFYIIQNNRYILKCLRITNNIKEELTLLIAQVPICDYSVCICDDHIDIAYVAELHGKYQLIYYNSRSASFVTLCNTIAPSNPVVFWYYDYLWINYLDENKLNILLSIDGGRSFSAPAHSSIQNNIRRYTFKTFKDCSLNCTELYASVMNVVHLCTLYTVDFDHLHLDSKIPLEMELLLEGLTLSNSAHSRNDGLIEENKQLKEQLRVLKLKYELGSINVPMNSLDNSDAPNTVKSAATAFMEELPVFDVPPRL